eukprot:g22452.t1
MGSGASTEEVKGAISGKSPEEIAAALRELPADQLAKIKDACNKGGPCPGPVDCSAITVVAKDYKGLLEQPKEPKFKGALCQIFVRGQPYGGSDKSNNGHRYDSIPMANGMINAGMSCQLIHYTHEEHDTFFTLCKKFDFIIVRCNPGQIKADGGDQQKFDDGMRALRKAGIQIWPSPDVMEKMGAKDALCKVATMNIGLEDTLAYYTPEEFAAGFKKTMAFQPRVIKQNRGSSGEGIWIIKLKEENYCKEYGERSCEDSEKLLLMEANDNHEEEHTVAEFIEFCVAGRTEKSGEWTSKGVGKYLEGGKEAGGQLVDQRFCPRIVEGELRYNLIGDSLIGVIHKKPKEGGISAVKWSERQKAQARVERLLSFSVVQQWRDSGESCSIDTVDWSAVDSVVHVGGGSGGVLLVRFATGRLLCVKPQRLEARGELFASFLADALGIPTARLRVLPMTEQIMSCLRNAKLEISDHQLHGPIMEGEDFTKHFRGCSDDRLKRFWVGAGQLAAFDCLINNLDRLPLIWANDGNLKMLGRLHSMICRPASCC